MYLLAVSSPTKSIPFVSSSTILPDSSKVGGFCCHAGFDLLDGNTGRNLMGSSVPLPLLPRPLRPGVNYKYRNKATMKTQMFIKNLNPKGNMKVLHL